MIGGITVRELLLCVPFFALAAIGAVLVDGGPVADIGLTLAAGIFAGGA
ncbi:MAG: hypothetical protein H0V29_11280, partial [Thermoleophilaceae bacterium]|nr:hypothetical protein [Thermoleophilaceae bacterium]